IEESELLDLSVPHLGDKAEALGLDWYHLPVEDGGVPDDDFEALWLYTGHRLRRALSRGEGILIHCKGGLGRTGTIAARLLIELGDPPDEAIKKVREARFRTVETKEQEHYLRKCAPSKNNQAYIDRVLGCLLGGAVGDALGYKVEFDRWDSIQEKYGPAGLQEIQLHDGVAPVSDDTQMTLFTLEGMLRALRGGTSVIHEIRRAYMDWLATQERPAPGWRAAGALCHDARLQRRRAPGNTCVSALRTGYPIASSKGCGGVMRIAPLGLIREWSALQSFEFAAQAAELTHGHPTGYLSAGAFASMIKILLNGESPAAAAEQSLAILKSKPAHGETHRAIIAALDLNRKGGDSLPVVKHLGEGWIAEEALAIGLHSALSANSFPDILRIAANHDGDSDSTASIAGQAYGAWRGLADLPNRWIRRIDVLVPLLRLAGELIEIEAKTRSS
ncbi:MAG TPA: ADP-ribosylglycohydrolase family protein, partial [Candidatus Binataceae bacterium]|nr:ADP-ribosylglycohydrolase family protein [Candidatus Binataceae bacterium]